MSLLLLLRDDLPPYAPFITPPVVGLPWRLGISLNGADANARFLSYSLDITHMLGARSTMRGTIIDTRPDTANAFRPQQGWEMVASNASSQSVFAGEIVDITDSPRRPPNSVTGSDVTALGHEAIAGSRFLRNVTFGGDRVPLAIVAVGNPAAVTTMAPHLLATNDWVTLEGVVSSTPAVDGSYQVTVITPNTFTIPLNVTVAGGGGTVRKVTRLKTIMQYLAGVLAENGVVLDMPNDGPLMEKQVFNSSVEDALSSVRQSSGWINRFLPTKVLECFQPGDKVAPWTFDGTNIRSGLTWLTSGIRSGNRVFVRWGKSGTSGYEVDYIRGDGVRRVFPLELRPFYDGVTSPGQVFDYAVGAWRHVGIYGVDTLFEWTYRASDNSLVQLSVSSTPPTANLPLANGALINFTYLVNYPQETMKQDVALIDAAKGPKELIITAEEITNRNAAAQRAVIELDRAKITPPRRCTFPSAEGLTYPGTKVLITLLERAIPTLTNFLVTMVRQNELRDGSILYTYECLEGDKAYPSWVEQLKQRLGQTSVGGGSSAGGPVPTPATLPPPLMPIFGKTSYFLGGSGFESVFSATPTWIAASAVQVRINAGVTDSLEMIVTVRLKARNAGVGVQARLFNVTDGVACPGVSDLVTSQTFVTKKFTTQKTVGEKYYELQLLPTVANQDVYAVGQME